VVAVHSDSILVRNNNLFALELYRQVSTAGANVFYCPFSISAALAMTYAGARGTTEAQMSRVLHFDTDQPRFHADYKELLKHLNSLEKKDSIEMSLANSMWVQKDYPFLSSYTDLVKKQYKAGLKNVDFRTELNKSRLAINKWVEDETNAKIKDLLVDGSLSDLTRLVLVNAIYFKGAWEKPFRAEDTRKMDFISSAEKTVNTDFMSVENKFAYAETEAIQVLELPYAGKSVSMIVFLPKQTDGIASLEKGFSIDNYYAWTTALKMQNAKVFLPKFSMTAEFELSDVLKKMGMTDAFSLTADFSGMTGTKDLLIDKVVHKAFIDVSEKGTEAAAATAVVIREKSMPVNVVTFRADHPFMFVLRDNATNNILFIGKVANPSAAAQD
jgi:serpin B